jgi:ARG/rhodanese/phosphatase superfamily protein
MLFHKPNVLEGLRHAEIAGAGQAAALQIFGLKWTIADGHDYSTLDEALEQKSLEVSEVDASGRVPTIKVVNKSDRMIFLMAGEELVGGKQNRVLNASMMVPARGEMPIPVTCVERGRWGYKSKHFVSGSTSSHSTLRRIMTQQVSGSYKAAGRPTTDQGAVWSEVDRKMEKMGAKSSSDALHDLYTDYAKKLDEMVGHCSLPEGANGAAFAISGKIIGADFFDKPGTLRKLWSKLVRSYAADALEDTVEHPATVEAREVSEWLRSASSAEQHWFDSPGVGKDVRIEGESLVGASLVVDQHLIHLELFREEQPEGQPVAAR